jgi:CMP-N,N'-diacetyllegionaminic acid synthase
MIGGHRVIAIVPARGGSKAVPLKNIKELGGKPLLAWAIEVGKATPEIDRVLVSTDHLGIAEVARQYGAEVLERPAELATDTALVAPMLRHHFAELRAGGDDFRYAVLLEPTSPFRRPDDVSRCLAKLDSEGLDSVATFVEAELNPHRAWRLTENGPEVFIEGAVPWLPRQKLPKAHQLNGAVYAFVADGLTEKEPTLLFGRTGAVEMDRRRSLDINDAVDFHVADAILASGVLTDP